MTDCSLNPDFSTSKFQAQNMLCTTIVLNVKTKTKKQFMYITCSELVVFMYWIGKSMNNLLSYCGLVDARIRASNKDLPVHTKDWKFSSIFVGSVHNFGKSGDDII